MVSPQIQLPEDKIKDLCDRWKIIVERKVDLVSKRASDRLNHYLFSNA